ncbi:hypothetical protein N7471_009740 [Penicillium samsonianum]|uniref:uncharacterized protein n=1 Tax=Penicillium samsonianum TaxID=1882272 RepID=UPI0025466B86|nr:uncharacterized protein N7471_009740 [Penicillium samsonianum]KAJ6128523.1 hypothetical protein N7471_009740 [Penicillium samsonianum]
MEGPSKLPELADGHGEVPSSAQASSAENTSVSGYEVSQPNHDTMRNNLAVEPFQPVLEILKQLEEEDTELAFRVARLVGYYRCVWESCVSKHTDGKQLEEENEKLRTGNIQLYNEGSHLKLRQDEQVARLHSIENALDEVRGNLIGVLKVWNDRSAGELAILPGDGFPRH